MPLPTGALQLAGFLMVHAFWITSELPADGQYVPQALCETPGGVRQLTSFDAPTPAESAQKARDFLGSAAGQYANCALARETKVDTGKDKVPAIVIDLLQGDDTMVTVLQPFRPATAEGGFRLLGDEYLFNRDGALPVVMAAQAGSALREGASDHPGIEDKWAAWNRDRDPRGPLAP